jgi:hypothetical protein
MYVAGIDITELTRNEVEGLHDFFVAWFRGDVPDTDDVYARFTDATHTDFTMVVTVGQTLDRGAVLGFVRGAHASRSADFRIEIREFEARVVVADCALVTYEEWQFEGDQLLSTRTSTAYFVTDPAAPLGVSWRHLHETSHPTGV